MNDNADCDSSQGCYNGHSGSGLIVTFVGPPSEERRFLIVYAGNCNGGRPMPQVVYEVRDRIAYITMNRPDKLNAMTHEMLNGLWKAFTSPP